MLQLRGTFSPNLRMAPLLDGTVKPNGIEIAFESGQAGELHERHLRDNAFDVFEFSISHYMQTKLRPGRWDWAAIPIFFSKAFMTLDAQANVSSGVESAADIKGRRMGVPDYSMTAALWFRAMLRELYDCHTSDVEWVVGRTKEHSHGSLLGMDESDFPSNIKVTWPNRPGALNDMLQNNEIQVAYAAGEEVPLDKTSPKIRPLFPDGGRAFVESFVKSTGFAPVNHTVVVQRRILEKDPWVAEALFEAFEESKRVAYQRDPKAAALFPRQSLEGQAEVFGADPFKSGLAANRPMLKMAAEQAVEDGLSKQIVDIPSLFWESLQNT
jgi:4,5-dihydroxyphthalate decarboxylase